MKYPRHTLRISETYSDTYLAAGYPYRLIRWVRKNGAWTTVEILGHYRDQSEALAALERHAH